VGIFNTLALLSVIFGPVAFRALQRLALFCISVDKRSSSDLLSIIYDWLFVTDDSAIEKKPKWQFVIAARFFESAPWS
jgi:hypothetical protein